MRTAPKTIVLVVNGLVLAGAEGQVVRLAEHLSAVGHRVVVATLFEPEAHVERLAAAGVEVVVLGHQPVRAVTALTLLLRRRRADAVASFLFQANIVTLVAAAAAATPRTVTSIRNERLVGRGRERLLRLLLPLGHLEVTNSASVADRLVERRVLRAERTVVVPNAVDFAGPGDAPEVRAARQSGKHTERDAIRAELGLGGDFTWLCVARLRTEQKGLDVLLEAFGLVVAAASDHPPRLLVAGAGPDRAALEALADELGCGSRVVFLGERDDVPRLLAAADGFVLASRWEGSPNAVLEAVAAEVPVVATAVGGVADLLGSPLRAPQGRAVPGADLVAPGDAPALAAMLSEVAARPTAERAARAQAARLRVEAVHHPATVGAAWERVLVGPGPVALFLQSFKAGGAQRVFLTLAGQLQAQGVDVDLVVATTRGDLAAEVPDGPRLVDLGGASTLAALPALVRHLRRHRPAALISTLDNANVIALTAVALARTATPTVIRVANTTSVLAGRARGVDRLVYLAARVLYRHASALIAPSAGAARDLERWLGLPEDTVSVLANPVVGADLERGRQAPLTHPWFAPGEPPVVLAVCRLERHKGLLNLLAAFAEVRAAVPCRLVILGEGPERDRLAARAAELGLADAVDLPGFDPNPYRYLARAAVFVLASEVEGLPGALIQALACGCPVVATDCPSGPREILDGGAHGRLVPVGDVAALVAALVGALAQGRTAPDPAAWAPYTWEHSTAGYLALLQRLDESQTGSTQGTASPPAREAVSSDATPTPTGAVR